MDLELLQSSGRIITDDALGVHVDKAIDCARELLLGALKERLATLYYVMHISVFELQHALDGAEHIAGMTHLVIHDFVVPITPGQKVGLHEHTRRTFSISCESQNS